MLAKQVRIAVTGATGFIGRHVLAVLQKKNIPFVALGRTQPEWLDSNQFAAVDLLQGNLPAAITGTDCTHLIHLAWYAEHGQFWTSRANFDWSAATVALARAFCAEGGHVTAIGTCAEYDWTSGVCTEGSTPTVPNTLYGKAKAATGQLVRAACEAENTSCCWARLFLPFGQGENDNRLIPSVIDACLGKRAPFPVGIDNWRDFLAVEDVADAIVHLTLGSHRGEFNICSGEPRRIGDVVNEISRYAGTALPPFQAHDPAPGDARWLIGNNERLHSTGWHPSTSFSDRLKNYVAARRKN